MPSSAAFKFSLVAGDLTPVMGLPAGTAGQKRHISITMEGPADLPLGPAVPDALAAGPLL